MAVALDLPSLTLTTLKENGYIAPVGAKYPHARYYMPQQQYRLHSFTPPLPLFLHLLPLAASGSAAPAQANYSCIQVSSSFGGNSRFSLDLD